MSSTRCLSSGFVHHDWNTPSPNDPWPRLHMLTCSAAAWFHVRRFRHKSLFLIHRVIPLNECPFSSHLGLLAWGNPHLKLLALVLPYSENPTGIFDTVFILPLIPFHQIRVISLNKSPFSHPLILLIFLSSISDFGGNPQPRQQHIFGCCFVYDLNCTDCVLYWTTAQQIYLMYLKSVVTILVIVKNNKICCKLTVKPFHSPIA